MSINWKNLGLVLGGVVVAALLCGLMAWVANIIGGRIELANWKAQGYTYKTCPFPIRYKNEIPNPTAMLVEKTVASINQLGRKLKYGPIYSSDRGRITITIAESTQEMRRPGGLCQPVHVADNQTSLPAHFSTFAWRAFTRTQELRDGTVFLCLQKHLNLAVMVKRPVDPPDLHLILKHELAHPLITHQHPRYWCGLTCAAPSVTTITDQTILKIRKIFDPLCLPKK